MEAISGIRWPAHTHHHGFLDWSACGLGRRVLFDARPQILPHVFPRTSALNILSELKIAPQCSARIQPLARIPLIIKQIFAFCRFVSKPVAALILWMPRMTTYPHELHLVRLAQREQPPP